jgi:hypothetical protein
MQDRVFVVALPPMHPDLQKESMDFSRFGVYDRNREDTHEDDTALYRT